MMTHPARTCILVLGTEPVARRVLRLALETKGFKVIESQNPPGIESLDSLGECSLALIDISLPNLQEVISHVLASGLTKVVLYGENRNQNGEDNHTPLPFGLLTQPFDLDEIGLQVDRILNDDETLEGELLEGKRTDLMSIKRIAQFLQEGLWIATSDNEEVIFYNRAFERMMGLRPDSKKTQFRWIDLIHPDDKERAIRYLSKVRAGLGSHPIDLRVTAQNGSTHWVKSKVFCVYDEASKEEVLIGLDIDVTHQERLKAIVEKNEKLFKSIFDKSQVAISIFNSEGLLIAVNRACLNLLGVKDITDLFDMNMYDFYGITSESLKSDEYKTLKICLDFDELRKAYGLRTSREGSAFLELAVARLDMPEPQGYIIQVIDVTEKEIAKRSLIEERDRTQKYLDLARAIIMVTDDEGNITSINKYGSELLGVGKTEDAIISILDYIPEQSIETAKQHFLGPIHTKSRESTAEIPLVLPDGSERCIRWKSAVVSEADAEETSLISYGDDLTDIKLLSNELAARESILHRVFESIPVGIMIVDLSGNIESMNKSLLEIMGIPKQDTSSWRGIQDDPGFAQVIGKIREAKESFQTDIEYNFDLTREKGIIPTLRRGKGFLRINAALMDSNGTSSPPSWVMIIQDVTETKEFTQRTQYLARILESVSEAVISTDRKLRVLSWNKAAEEIYGILEEDALGKSFFEIVPTEFADPEEYDPLKAVFLDGRWNGEGYQITKRGERILCRFSISLLRDDSDAIEGLIFIIQNVTTEKETKRQLKAERDRAMLYLDLMGHDIRNKLQAMMMGYDIISQVVERDEIVEEMIEQIQQSAEACTDLISKVKKTEKLTAVPLEIHDLKKVVEDAVLSFRDSNPDIEIILNCAVQQANVIADEFIDDLVYTFLENAVHHNHRERKRVWVSLEQISGKFLLAISDNGPGISDERKKWLFDKTRRFGGVGLHQAKQIADKYGAKIIVRDRIANEFSSGARFDIWFQRI